MRVLQVNAVYKTRSTGRIAKELHEFFQSKEIDSYVAYAILNTEEKNDLHVFRIGSTLDHKLHAMAYRVDHMQGHHSRLATKRFLKKIERLRPDVVLTHNLHSNYLHFPLFLRGLKRLGIPVVLAMHDCWYMTGGCYHYTAQGCDKWLSGCRDCAMLGAAAAKRFCVNEALFREVRPTIVATSKWIEREARRSVLSQNCDIHMIYDWIDTETFYPRDGSAVRAKYNIGEKTMILGVSTGWSEEKGQQEMIEIAQAMPDAAVVLVGNQPQDAKYPPNVITIAFTDSKEELAELYSAADVFFNPSKQETFGLVSGEALACGTPLVVYDTTACPEFVTPETGAVMHSREDVVPAVRRVLENNQAKGRQYVRNRCRSFVTENFDMSTNVGKYIELFKALTIK